MDVSVDSGVVKEVYPEVFNTIPPQTNEKKPGQLNEEQLKQFYEEGYILVEEFFTPEELEPVRHAVDNLVEELAQKLYKAGKVKKLYSDYGLFERLTMLEKEFPGASILLHKNGKMPQAVRDLWSNERLLNVVEQLIGPDIVGHPVWNLRTKTPKNDATVVPWHQDSAYFDNESYRMMIPTAWIPLLDANENNGCMQVVKNGHKKGKVATHTCCAGPTWYVMLDEEVMEKSLDVDLNEDLVTVPVPYGGFLLFNNLTPHRSLNNYSSVIRWSFDLRWSSLHDPIAFWGLKDGVLLRSSKDPNLKVDWEPFLAVDRTTVQSKALNKEEDEFNTTISGPWMKKWDIVNHNRHTKGFAATGQAGNP
ncbi:uncharacterized protein LOC106177775 [Lingula anatina]|uniref:Uncharacterized protein LOC106177775 n=1 Tax=Lingula anatina TaxID=7574 RepID=A0A1S3K0D8_LINAN|nr:uncharacterized protein LOC106177775 [Lingula anatina]|eukprot:XP_013416110.1 uncharacterized protein LOC106177775 [Lingula anatina]